MIKNQSLSKPKSTVIFLDIDGVLNGLEYFKTSFYKYLGKKYFGNINPVNHIFKFFKSI